MRFISDILTVSFSLDTELEDKAALCVVRRDGEKVFVLKMESGEQANTLYRLLTEQMAKAEVKPFCPNCEATMKNENQKSENALNGIAEGFEKFTKMMFKQGQVERDDWFSEMEADKPEREKE